jgi:hypothetical protein
MVAPLADERSILAVEDYLDSEARACIEIDRQLGGAIIHQGATAGSGHTWNQDEDRS